MNEMEIKKYLDEYFCYIKTVFLSEYSRYLNPDKIQKIKDMNDIFRVDSTSKFKIFITDKINVCTNIGDFIMDNNLNNDRDLKDISINGRIYVKYLIDNKDKPERVILESIIRPIIKYFIGKTNNVIEIGIIDLIVSDLVNKYNLKNVKPYDSKELEIAEKIKNIVSEPILYSSVLNNKIDIVENKYNECINEEIDLMDFDTLIREAERKYNNYYKRIGKVYYSDTLYDYENINYNCLLSELDKINNFHSNDINSKICHFKSTNECILNLKEHSIMFDSHEQFMINNSLIEIDNILNKINTSNVDEYYSKLEKIEEELFPLTQKVWNKQLTHPLVFSDKDSFKFLIGDYPNSEYVETRLISDRQLMNINCAIKNYGFLYVTNNNIIYSSTKNFLYTKDKFGNLEIDDKKDSKLLTPQLIINENIKSKNLTGKTLLKNALPYGVYALCENELSSDYIKAYELSKKYELPLIKLDKNYYRVNNKEEKSNKIVEFKQEKISGNNEIDKSIKKDDKHRLSLADKIKQFNKKIIYDEDEIEEFKKIL